jgi:hypothetical protein
MARYEALVGKRVEAHYRAGDIHLSAIGTLAADSGKSIVLEDRFSLGGKDKTMRVEIPYEYVIRVVETKAGPAAPAPAPYRPSAPKKRS